MLTFNNDLKLKEALVSEAIAHRKADEIVQGHYGRQNGHWQGCFIACTLRSLDKLEGKPLKTEYDDHTDFERRGIGPEWLARLCEQIFENLPQKESVRFLERVYKAIPVGVDIEPVKWKFCAFLLSENIERVLNLYINAELKEQVVAAIRQLLVVHENAIQTGKWDKSAARSAAWSAARSDRKSTRLNSSHPSISYAVFCLKKKNHLNRRSIDS